METELDEMKEVAREVRMETVLDLLALDHRRSARTTRAVTLCGFSQAHRDLVLG